MLYKITWWMDLGADDGFGDLDICIICWVGCRWPRGPSGRGFRPQKEVIQNLLAFPWKMSNLSFELESTFTKCSKSSTRHEGINSHNMCNFKGTGKLASYSFKVNTIQVYCLRLSCLGHSLKCTFPSLLLWCKLPRSFLWLWLAWNVFCCRSNIFAMSCWKTLLKVM